MTKKGPCLPHLPAEGFQYVIYIYICELLIERQPRILPEAFETYEENKSPLLISPKHFLFFKFSHQFHAYTTVFTANKKQRKKIVGLDETRVFVNRIENLNAQD